MTKKIFNLAHDTDSDVSWSKTSNKYLNIIMDIVINMQCFRDIEENFIPKEVAVLTINATMTGHWIVKPTYPFGNLPNYLADGAPMQFKLERQWSQPRKSNDADLLERL